jgi:hypothetical protein
VGIPIEWCSALLKRIAVPLRIASCLLIVPQIAIVGQTLGLSPAAARQGERMEIEISLKSPTGKEPQALQWETTIPAAQLGFVENNLQPGQAAQAAEKSFTCVVKNGSTETRTRTLACVLAGGLKVIPNGVVAVLRLEIPAEAKPGPASIRTGRGIAVLKGPKEIPLAPVERVVTVRPPSPHPPPK